MVDIEETGESSLFIFQDSITSLEPLDQIGLFDSNGIIDSNGNTGEILVGSGFWTGSQLEITGIHAVDLSQFGGPILPGATEGNSMNLKVFKVSDQTEYDVIYNIGSGSGYFLSLMCEPGNFVPPILHISNHLIPFLYSKLCFSHILILPFQYVELEFWNIHQILFHLKV